MALGGPPPPTPRASSLPSGECEERRRAGTSPGPQPSVQAPGPSDMPSWAPGERPGAEAHVGNPAGQGQSCPLLCMDGLQGTAEQEAVV